MTFFCSFVEVAMSTLRKEKTVFGEGAWTPRNDPGEEGSSCMREKIDQSPLKIIDILVLKLKKQHEKQGDDKRLRNLQDNTSVYS